MIIKNAMVFDPDCVFRKGDILIRDGLFADMADTADDEEVFDADGLLAVPGFIDIHFHGCLGQDFCDGSMEAIHTLAVYEARNGVTAICPATLTLPAQELKSILKTADTYRRSQAENSQAADLIGINMEGPFISSVKKGAQNGAYILPCDAALCREFCEVSGGLVKIIGLAPEDNPDFEAYIEEVKDLVHVSLAHTNAPYDAAKKAIEAGACHAVHLFNAMSGFGHRDPGVVGAVFDSPQVMAELICDGNHLHPAVVRTVFRILGPARTVLVSDSLRATGLGDGPIMLGGQEVIVSGTKATLKEGGNLAGSVTNLTDCMRIAVKEMGIALEDAVRSATINPAKAIGADDRYGSIEHGKKGNVVLLYPDDLRLAAVIKDGKVIRQTETA